MTLRRYSTQQEEFWAGSFGTDYIDRNDTGEVLATNLSLFSAALERAGRVSSCVELGANIGHNLRALRLLYPQIELKAVEINPDAARRLEDLIGKQNVFEGSMLDYPVTETVDLALTKGVLIHINPEKLSLAYEKLYQASRRLILICEYYSPTPVAISYRGHTDRLFKRDFAGEMLDTYSALALVDYGFVYHRDPAFRQDDLTWFLLEKGPEVVSDQRPRRR
jgi:pseudaminic acid biosynthesis-associated methylase